METRVYNITLHKRAEEKRERTRNRIANVLTVIGIVLILGGVGYAEHVDISGFITAGIGLAVMAIGFLFRK